MESTLKSQNILIVDDMEEIFQVFRELFKDVSNAIYHSYGDDDLLALILEKHIDILFLDNRICGPKLGLDWLKILRAHLRDIIIIFITGLGSEEIAVQALLNGADDYIKKPFNIDNVMDRLNSVMIRRRAITIYEDNLKLDTAHSMLVTIQHRLNNILGVMLVEIGELLTFAESGEEKVSHLSIKGLHNLHAGILEIGKLFDQLNRIKKIEFEDYAAGIKMLKLKEQ
ncbi:response regulator [Candidatus Dependentiae bacterium]|nr:response regulator [Candidatus Dependentiae bacterium]